MLYKNYIKSIFVVHIFNRFYRIYQQNYPIYQQNYQILKSFLKKVRERVI